MTIELLTNDTIGKIAAGEVIERPAAAVKELVENAIDAQATRIDVSIGGGGIEWLEVRDDGIGIPITELTLAVQRHATSKLRNIDDLGNLGTLGFRGEALASLAAISNLRIQSNASTGDAPGQLDVPFGIVSEPRVTAFGRGTSIHARDLFENVPARRKFLRQPSTETNYVTRMVGAYALAYPHIAFTMEVDGRQLFATPGSGDRIGAAVAVWGADIAASLVEIQTSENTEPGYAVSGIVSLPDLHRATRQQQHLFAQGRLITSRQLGTAFEQAYSTLLMIGRHPLGCIIVNVPPERIDVNVHPTKAEVRFADERLVFALVQRAVREAVIAIDSRSVVPTVVTTPLTDWNVQRRLSLAHPEWAIAQSHPEDHSQIVGQHDELPTVQPVGGQKLPMLRVLGQIASMFIIAEGPDGMYMIDQHAAHERIMFEKLMPGFVMRSSDRQAMLQPLSVELSPAQWKTYQDSTDELAAIGFELEPFGDNTVLIRSVPAITSRRDPGEMLVLMLEEIQSGGRGDSRLESLAISAACHASIRANQPLSLLEMRELVLQLENCSSPLACGHGRPTMLRMTAEELAKQFERR